MAKSASACLQTPTVPLPLVHPGDAGTAWFVPAVKDEKRYPVDGRLVVTRTRNAGKIFETLTAGLPQAHAYDLVYRHARDVDPTGDLLAFGSTTGSLWISENGGDTWQTLSSNLPLLRGPVRERQLLTGGRTAEAVHYRD